MSIKALSLALFGAVTIGLAPSVSAATSLVTVRASDTQGWSFNSDPRNTTPYEFTADESSIGDGSLEILPIGTNAADKFTAAKVVGLPADQITSFSYDYLIGGNGDSADANQFYLNVYTKAPGSALFYDCRFDYAPTAGSTTDFTTATFNATDTPTNVATFRDSTLTCPATLSALPADYTVSFVTLNVGDTTTSDSGIGGYFDNVVFRTASDVTTYDFEPELTFPANKEACKKDGWKTFTGREFKNQGDCVSYVASGDKANGNPANKPTF